MSCRSIYVVFRIIVIDGSLFSSLFIVAFPNGHLTHSCRSNTGQDVFVGFYLCMSIYVLEDTNGYVSIPFWFVF